MKHPTPTQLKAQITKLMDDKDYTGIHAWLCHPYVLKCSDWCRRDVKKDRLAIYGEVCDER